MPAIRGSWNDQRDQELRRQLLVRLPEHLIEKVVINRSLTETPDNAASVRASKDTAPDEVARVISAVEACGIAVQPFTRHDLEPTPKLYCYADEQVVAQCKQLLNEAGIVCNLQKISCVVTDLSGKPAPYLEVYGADDGALLQIRDILGGNVDLELYFSSGMVFVPMVKAS